MKKLLCNIRNYLQWHPLFPHCKILLIDDENIKITIFFYFNHKYLAYEEKNALNLTISFERSSPCLSKEVKIIFNQRESKKY